MTEIYKIINHIAPPKSSLFEIRENTHNTKFSQVLSNESRRIVNYGLETICYRTPFLWANLLPEYKLANYLNYFEKKKKNLEWRKLSMQVMQNVRAKLGCIQFSSESINICCIFFSFLMQLKKTFNAQPFTEKKIKNSL